MSSAEERRPRAATTSRSRTMLVIVITTLVTLALLPSASALSAAEEEQLCSGRSCYPATGNLVIGRQKQLSANSTCGLRGRERYCIVSHLEDDTKCFICDSREPWNEHTEAGKRSHRIENIVTENYDDRTKNWWQSVNGEQAVQIQFDLEAEFHFTHLIMTFRSFRPSAMYISKSSDYGKTWHIYRYFAADCQASFPGIPERLPVTHNDVICTRKYSDVAPSTGGELIYKVISPHIPTDNPYAQEISSLLRITNLRIVFVKLHTLGDDLLDYRRDISEKYFYSIYEMVVRGSCSCYGHARTCHVGDGDKVNAPADMVGGRCSCMHHTTGSNCEKCEPFYNDAPWRPAYGEHANECQRCQCNNHAHQCHFSESQYIATSNTSGGVCDDCQHNTQGQHCEQCKPFFFRERGRRIDDPYSCSQCRCDKRGSLYDGLCEGEDDAERGLTAGKCYCKPNVDGTNCDRCKDGFWNLQADSSDGCQPCTCNLLGTYNNEGCNKMDGSCTCKPNVIGELCDRCAPNHFGMSRDAEGCKSCDCELGSSLEDQCDVVTGACRCRDGFTGRRCNVTESGFYCATIDHYTFEAESNENTMSGGEVVTRETTHGRPAHWTGVGFVEVREGANISFPISGISESGQYNIVVRYEVPNDGVGWEDVKLTVVRPDDPSSDGPCANSMASDDFLIARLPSGTRWAEVQPAICLESDVNYHIRLYLGDKRGGQPDDRARILIDSIVLVPQTTSHPVFSGSSNAEYKRQLFERYQCRDMILSLTPPAYWPSACNQTLCTVSTIMHPTAQKCDCDVTGSVSGICPTHGGQCECKSGVTGRKCDRCMVGHYGFGPTGCSPCACDSVGSLHNNCDKDTGQCNCRDRGVHGRACDLCAPGFFSHPTCEMCRCNGHAETCDSRTGACIDCRDLTEGNNCERCRPQYYGDPRLGVTSQSTQACRPCPCPGGPGSGLSHADTCYLKPGADPNSQDVICNCRLGYQGEHCDTCSQNYFGNPKEIGGSCERCDCSGNIDVNVPESCDSKTGVCLRCLHNTAGEHCEVCRPNYFGNALQRHCRPCACNQLGTNKTAGACNAETGQCPCLPNVININCDECAPRTFNIASNKGCEQCACDPTGVVPDANGEIDLECNRIDGRCRCKAGRGGRTCAECEDLHWGDPTKDQCQRCECDPYGSETQQCDRQTGQCHCRPGSGGIKCDRCERGYFGRWPQCQSCGECFTNWDRILGALRNDLDRLIERANNIEDTGISSEYDETFDNMEKQLADVRAQLASINITQEDVEGLRKQIELLQTETERTRAQLSTKNDRVTAVVSSVDLAARQVDDLRAKETQLTRLAEELRNNATLIRQSDTKSAFDLLKELAGKSSDYQRLFSSAVDRINAAETDRNKAEQLLNEHKADFDAQYEENQKALADIEQKLADLEGSVPALNAQVCGGETAECDEMCGGPSPSCGRCGGESCVGSVSKAKQALDFANEAHEKLQEKQKEAEDLLRRLRDTDEKTNSVQQFTRNVHEQVESTARLANETKTRLEAQAAEIRAFLDGERATPEGIEAIVNEIVAITIPFDEAKIRELSEEIRNKVLKTQNTDQILAETRGNKTVAESLQANAEAASRRADDVHATAVEIRDALSKAQTAQTSAQSTLEKAVADNEELGATFDSTENEVQELETRARDTSERLGELQNKTDQLKASYIKITSSSRSAGSNAQSASEIVKNVELKHGELENKYKQVETLLDERVNGNEQRKERAERLHQRTTDLLSKIRSHNDDAEALKRSADSLDVELGGFRQRIDVLDGEIDKIAAQIEQRVEYHASCDA